MIDAVAVEPHFLDHIAPVWSALPRRGRLLVASDLMGRSRRLGLDAEPIDVVALKRGEPHPPKAAPGDGPLALVASIGDTKIARRLGYRRFVSMEHGAGQAYLGDQRAARNPSYAGGADREDSVLFLQPNAYSADLVRAAYPAARVEVVGSPRLDSLPAREPGPLTVAISFHWPGQMVAPEAGTAEGHFRSVLPELAKRFRVIGHAHPKADWPARMRQAYARAGIPFVDDFDGVCRGADVYVCDNSSTLFEFAATGRPVVVLNSPMYRRNVRHGLRFWDAAHVGINVDQPGHLIAAVERALEHRPEDVAAREDALETVYAYRHGAAERAADAIAAYAGEQSEVAA